MERILFSAKWCAPCGNLKEHAKTNSLEFDSVLDIDTNEGRDMAIRHGVRGVPTVILLDEGREINRMIGFQLEKLNEIFEGSK